MGDVDNPSPLGIAQAGPPLDEHLKPRIASECTTPCTTDFGNVIASFFVTSLHGQHVWQELVRMATRRAWVIWPFAGSEVVVSVVVSVVVVSAVVAASVAFPYTEPELP